MTAAVTVPRRGGVDGGGLLAAAWKRERAELGGGLDSIASMMSVYAAELCIHTAT